MNVIETVNRLADKYIDEALQSQSDEQLRIILKSIAADAYQESFHDCNQGWVDTLTKKAKS